MQFLSFSCSFRGCFIIEVGLGIDYERKQLLSIGVFTGYVDPISEVYERFPFLHSHQALPSISDKAAVNRNVELRNLFEPLESFTTCTHDTSGLSMLAFHNTLVIQGLESSLVFTLDLEGHSLGCMLWHGRFLVLNLVDLISSKLSKCTTTSKILN
jgi:hypothetical protein